MRDTFLYLLQNLIILDILIIVLWVLEKNFHWKVGHLWRKWIWLFVCIRMIFPVELHLSDIQEHWKGLQVEIEVEKEAYPADTEIIVEKKENSNDIQVYEPVIIEKEETEENSYESKNDEIVKNRSFVELLKEYWEIAIVFIWFIGFLGALFYHVFQYYLVKEFYFEDARVSHDEKLIQYFHHLCRKYHIKQIPVLLEKDDVATPMTFGYIHRKIVFPPDIYSKKELAFILKHELTHIKNFDSWYKTFVLIVCDLYWFNPIFVLMKQMAYRDVEYVCDEIVTRNMDLEEIKIYGTAILKTAKSKSSKSAPSMVQFAVNKTELKKRLNNLFIFDNWKKGSVPFAISLLIVAVLLLGISISVKEVIINPSDVISENANISIEVEEKESLLPTKEKLSIQENIEKNGDSVEETENSLEEQNYVTLLESMKDDTVEGEFFYEEPTEVGKDYNLYFKQKGHSDSSKIQYTAADMTYQLPDLREGNQSYGTPIEVYYSESAEFTGDERSDFLFAAVYEIEGGKQHICTRVYVGNNTGYEIDSQMSSYLDQKYDELEKKDYPLLDDMLDEIRELYEVYNKKYCLNLNETETLAWKSACMEVIQHMEEYLADPYEIRAFSNNYADKWVYISVIDFNHDEIPELVVGDGCSAAVFTYENSELHKIADLYQEGSVSAIYEKNETLLLTDSRCGTDAQNGYVAFCFSETDGEYKTGIYDGYVPDEITINGEGATLEEFNRVFGFEEMEQNVLEEIPYVRLIRTEEPCRIQLKNGENVYLDTAFDFNKILYHDAGVKT